MFSENNHTFVIPAFKHKQIIICFICGTTKLRIFSQTKGKNLIKQITTNKFKEKLNLCQCFLNVR